jgi:hypothetical protein
MLRPMPAPAHPEDPPVAPVDTSDTRNTQLPGTHAACRAVGHASVHLVPLPHLLKVSHPLLGHPVVWAAMTLGCIDGNALLDSGLIVCAAASWMSGTGPGPPDSSKTLLPMSSQTSPPCSDTASLASAWDGRTASVDARGPPVPADSVSFMLSLTRQVRGHMLCVSVHSAVTMCGLAAPCGARTCQRLSL